MALPLMEKNEEDANVEAGMKNDKGDCCSLGGDVVDTENEVLMEGDEMTNGNG
jgi:hypothetical protein